MLAIISGGMEVLGVSMRTSVEYSLGPLLRLIGASIACQYQLSPDHEASLALEIYMLT
jgi:hypothetical protein